MKAYPAYKESGVEWIGDIPVHWSNTRIRSVVESVVNGLWGDDPQGDENDIICVRVADFDMQKLGVGREKLTTRNIPESQKNGRLLVKDDLLIEKSGGGELQPVGRVIRFDLDEKAVTSNFIGKISANESKVLPVFLLYYFSNLYSKAINTRSIKQTTGIQNLDTYSYFSERISLPSLPEQQAIADFLDRKTAQIDTLIEKKQRQIDLLQEQRTALINHTVTGKLDLTGFGKPVRSARPMKDSGVEWLGEIPSHWEAGKLKYFAIINPTKNTDLVSKDSEDLVTFLPMEKVHEDGTYDISLKRSVLELWSGFTYFEEKDVIVAKITPCFENGKGAYLNNLDGKVGFGSTEFHVLRALPNITSARFLYYITRTNLFQVTGQAFMYGAAGQKRVPTDFVEDFPFSCPPLNEQESIADFLDVRTNGIDGLIHQVEQQIEYYKEYRTALISEAVTGKVDVRTENTVHE